MRYINALLLFLIALASDNSPHRLDAVAEKNRFPSATNGRHIEIPQYFGEKYASGVPILSKNCHFF